jgi:lipopolysaccharide export system protein LptA
LATTYSRYLASAIKLSILLICITCLSSSYALKEDRNQPIKLTADQAQLDDTSQEYVLIGNVKIVKGSLVVVGDKAVVIVDPEGYQQITVISKPGELADFSQRMDGPYNETTEGHGEFIFYDGKAETLLIKGQASAKKRVGINWRDKLEANEIFYDLATEKFRATSNDPKVPVKSIIAPKRKYPS